MVLLRIVPGGDEVVSVDHEGTEVLLPPPTAADAFAAAVKKMQLHKRKRGATLPAGDGTGVATADAAAATAAVASASASAASADGSAAAGDAAAASSAAGGASSAGDDSAPAAMEVDEEEEQQQQQQRGASGDKLRKRTRTSGEPAAGARDTPQNPFEEAQRELAFACYELRQLTELTGFLSERTLFRLENLQADEHSAVVGLSDILIAFEFKKSALDDAIGILSNGKDMILASQRTQRVYLRFIQEIQHRWRLQAIAHGNFSASLRAQEPLAVDCGYYSAGYRGRTARQRQTRLAARLTVKAHEDDADGAPESAQSDGGAAVVALDTDEGLLRSIRFAIESSSNGATVASAVIAPSSSSSSSSSSSRLDGLGGPRAASGSSAAQMSAVEAQLEQLQNSEFCSELFQTLSAEAVQCGELSSGGGAAADPGGVANVRSKVSVIENHLDRIAVSLDAQHNLVISLVPALSADPAADLGSPHSKGAQDFCRMACVVAQMHLRGVHRGARDVSLLAALVTKYQQMAAFERFSAVLDEIAASLTILPEGDLRCQLFKLSFTWTHREAESVLELWVGSQVLVRCKLARGHLSLGSIATVASRAVPHEWHVAQQSGNHIFACPHAPDKLKRFVQGLVRHEFLVMLKRALRFALGEESLVVHLDSSLGTLTWVSPLDGLQREVRVEFTDTGALSVKAGDENVTRPTVPDLVRKLVCLAPRSPG